LIAALQGYPRAPLDSYAERILNAVNVHGWQSLGIGADIIGVGMFAVLCFFLVRAAKQKLEA
jgi:microsomal dipeptidase-like Zn-dependent dipeptidase